MINNFDQVKSYHVLFFSNNPLIINVIDKTDNDIETTKDCVSNKPFLSDNIKKEINIPRQIEPKSINKVFD